MSNIQGRYCFTISIIKDSIPSFIILRFLVRYWAFACQTVPGEGQDGHVETYPTERFIGVQTGQRLAVPLTSEFFLLE
jgi:hypothetical protein